MYHWQPTQSYWTLQWTRSNVP